MPVSDTESVNKYPNSPVIQQEFAEGGAGRSNMRKRQVVLKREESSTTTSSFTVRTVRYAECQKNHAAGVGGYAVDGCREFMATGEEGTDAALICAACGCHRSFHRREVETEVVNGNTSPRSSMS
ncbi:hypothetical protein Patl1_21914 [Pistacia atlantica]|uniref:Uncharacterized protein n=1 Tax=Pistacia atlantica TaxID=434234 RepID=A0ACC1BMT2_9ROSI|nr:hypothetical protein Patl1_21914 [Pistacia atlantica]